MSPLLAEFLGTAILILLGDGVCANATLGKTKGNNGGYLMVTVAWALAVTIAVYCVGSFSGAHLNPAVTIGLLALGKFEAAQVPGYLAAQMLGAMAGATLVWLAYLPHWAATNDPAGKLGIFCTAPAIRHTLGNLLCEIIGTVMLVLGILAIGTSANLNAQFGWDTGFKPVLVGLLVWAIGMSLGGPTGWAINPARDLGPRIAHALLPIPGKGASDWGYAWIPVIGPIIGAVIAAMIFKSFWPA